MICLIGGKWSYSCYFAGYCFEDLIKTAQSRVLYSSHLAFSPTFSLESRWCKYTVVPTWRKSYFILSERIRFPCDRLPFICSPCLSYSYVDIGFSRWDIAAEVCELVYSFQKHTTKKGDSSFLFKTHDLCIICVHVKANGSCCLLQTVQRRLDLSRCIIRQGHEYLPTPRLGQDMIQGQFLSGV